MDGIDLAREGWPLLPVILTSGHPRERVGELQLGVAYMPKPWQPLNAITIIRPETLVRWHRAGFRRYWRSKSRSLGGRPQIDAALRALIRQMSVDKLTIRPKRTTAGC